MRGMKLASDTVADVVPTRAARPNNTARSDGCCIVGCLAAIGECDVLSR